jgi:hypothetical protein
MMRPYDKLGGVRASVVTVAACLIGLLAHAEGVIMDQDGWYTWTVPAVDSNSDWCCFSWRGGSATKQGCDLDGKNRGYGSSDDDRNDTGEMQIYALLKDGGVEQVRALSPMCPVTAESPINDLGQVSGPDSIDWLRLQIDEDSALNDDAIAAISMHNDPQALEALVATIENRKLQRDDRKVAVFWLAQNGSDEAMEYFDSIFD